MLYGGSQKLFGAKPFPTQMSLAKRNSDSSTTKQDSNKVKAPRGAPYYADIKIQPDFLISGKR
jgi:hypothetical protein